MEQPSSLFDDPLVIKEEIKEENDFEKQELVINAINDWSNFFEISKTALNSLLRILNKEFSFIPPDIEALQNNINAEKFEHATDFLDIHVDDDINETTNDSDSEVLIKESSNPSVRQTRPRRNKSVVKDESSEKSFDKNNDDNLEDSDHSDASVEEKRTKSTKSNSNRNKTKNGAQCPICGVFRQNMIIHMRIHTGERPYKCSECDMRFKDRSTRKTHEKVHTEVKAFKCDFCEKQFRSKANRMEHMRTHTGEKPYICQTCNERFRTSTLYRIHINNHGIPGVSKQYICTICDRSFQNTSTLNLHVRILHNGEELFKCSTCNKSFESRAKQKNHETRVHSDEKLFKCTECVKEFSQPHSLKAHYSAHHSVDKMMFNCTYCQKSFVLKCYLTKHLKRSKCGGRIIPETNIC